MILLYVFSIIYIAIMVITYEKVSKAVRQTDMSYVPGLLILQCLVWPLYLYRAYISVKKKREEREKSNEHKN